MFSRRLKTGYFILEGLNSFCTVYYLYYFYFYMQKAFGFGNKVNLALAALNGAVYAAASLWAGKFALQAGYFTALKLGFSLMSAALAVGLFVPSASGQIAIKIAVMIGLALTWPTLEALVSESEPPSGLLQMLGIYNLVWAATAALANFLGGAMLDTLGLQSLFYVPLAVLLIQLGLTFWLEAQAQTDSRPTQAAAPTTARQVLPRANCFRRMAWLANPFAYIAINTVVAVAPGVAKRLELSTMLAGFCCSVWCFSRLGAFLALWLWNGWHYRFRWLLLSYAALVATFAAILLAPNVLTLVLAQIFFGAAVGLIYSSSLFYSMDLSDTKSAHGGIHEAAIGLGNFAGPAVGAAALHFLPQHLNSGAFAVSLLLLGGLAGLGTLWYRGGNSH